MVTPPEAEAVEMSCLWSALAASPEVPTPAVVLVTLAGAELVKGLFVAPAAMPSSFDLSVAERNPATEVVAAEC